MIILFNKWLKLILLHNVPVIYEIDQHLHKK